MGKLSCCVNFHFILSLISDIEIRIALILLIMWFDRRLTTELVSQWFVGVMKSLSLAFSLMRWIMLGLILSIRRESSIHLSYKKLIFCHYGVSNIWPFLRRYLWRKMFFKAVDAMLDLLFWKKVALSLSYLSLTNWIHVFPSRDRMFQPCFARKTALTSSVSVIPGPPA